MRGPAVRKDLKNMEHNFGVVTIEPAVYRLMLTRVPGNHRTPYELCGPDVEFQTGTFDPFAMLTLDCV